MGNFLVNVICVIYGFYRLRALVAGILIDAAQYSAQWNWEGGEFVIIWLPSEETNHISRYLDAKENVNIIIRRGAYRKRSRWKIYSAIFLSFPTGLLRT